MNNNVVLKAVGLQKSYKEGGRLLHVLKDVNLEVHEGESVAIVGTSGSGKTTLLQCIGGLDSSDKVGSKWAEKTSPNSPSSV